MRILAYAVFAGSILLGCSSGQTDTTSSSANSGGAHATSVVGVTSTSAGMATTSGPGAGGGLPTSGAGGSAACVDVDGQTSLTIATAPTADEYALELFATSASHTSWATPGNEALILEVSGKSGLIGHLVLHQGADGFGYSMQVGALAAGETISIKVSDLSATAATHKACVGQVKLTSATDLGAAGEGLINAPILKWPVQKRFDDLPVALGWSKAKKHYELIYTDENGGTAALCGGGAVGMRAEIARWGRGCDMEGIFTYSGAVKQWERCTAITGYDSITPRQEAEHPILYYGDGHNRLFESRGGYGQTCGTSSDKEADGDIPGWNTSNPGNEQAKDDPYVVTIRPLPFSLDAIDYNQFSGRREGLVDTYVPWLYRIIDEELTREGKIDQSNTFGMQQYLYADIYAADVDGSGDKVCAILGANGGFVLRAQAGGETLDGPQMTADYFGGANNVKRIAIPLDQAYSKAQVTGLIFDAYDDDGMYWLQLGDVFMARPHGDNGATLDKVHVGTTLINQYVDDDNSGCTGGINSDGPMGPAPCAGSLYTFPL